MAARPGAALAALGWTALATTPGLLTGWAFAKALDDGFLAGAPVRGLAWLAVPAAAILPAAVGARRSVTAIGAIAESFRDELTDRVVTAGIASAVGPGGRPTAQAVLARVGQQVESARICLAGSITCLLGLVLSIGAVVLGQAGLSPVIALLTLVPILLCAVAFLAVMPSVLRAQRVLVANTEQVDLAVQSTTAGLRDLRAAGATEWARRRCTEQFDAQVRATRAAARLTAVRLLVIGLGGRLPTILLLVATPWLLRHGTTPGAITGSLTYTLGTLTPAVQAAGEGIGRQVVPLWINLDRLLAATCPVPVAEQVAAAPVLAGAAAPITVRGLTFRYGPSAEPVLSGLNLEVAAGEHLAVVGASGIGKSTLAALLCGDLRPTAGTVRVAGADPASFAPAARAELRVFLPQEAYVFTGTLAENLRYLNPAADEPALDRAVAAVGLYELRARVGGYAGRVKPGDLSGADRQLIALARAWLAPAPLVVLDEATCLLDATAEARAEQAFAERPGTLVVVAHRISSARRADRVLVVDGDRTCLGRHEELAAWSPMYRDLVGHWEHAEPGDAVEVRIPVGARTASFQL